MCFKMIATMTKRLLSFLFNYRCISSYRQITKSSSHHASSRTWLPIALGLNSSREYTHMAPFCDENARRSHRPVVTGFSFAASFAFDTVRQEDMATHRSIACWPACTTEMVAAPSVVEFQVHRDLEQLIAFAGTWRCWNEALQNFLLNP